VWQKATVPSQAPVVLHKEALVQKTDTVQNLTGS
jgi:hypothetical protein